MTSPATTRGGTRRCTMRDGALAGQVCGRVMVERRSARGSVWVCTVHDGDFWDTAQYDPARNRPWPRTAGDA